ncbi:MAG: hypoxanthine phosphoribosyltransferase [Eubacterium sp.]
MSTLNNDVSRVLVTQDELKAINERLGAQITKDFEGKNLLVVGILKGSLYFMADLTRYIDLPLKLDFLAVSSYGSGTRSSGAVKIVKDIDINLEGYDILLVEDILDSGRTLDYVSKMLGARGANSISIVTLLDKPERRVVDLHPDYVGCDVPDEFVVGYGLDYDQKYRNLPYIGALKREIYENNE